MIKDPGVKIRSAEAQNKVQTFVISSNSCNTASSSSWVKLPLKSSSISYGKKIKFFVNIWLKTAEIKAFQLISLTLWYSIPSLVSSIILSTSSMDIIWDKKYNSLPLTRKKIDMTFYLQIFICLYWLILVIEFKTADIALLMFWLVHSTPVISSCSESPHLESLNQCKGQRKEYFLILHSYLMHFLQSFISLLQSISYLKLNLSKLNILYLLYNDHSLSLTWIFYFMMGQVPRGKKLFL